MTIYSEREREFKFAKNESILGATGMRHFHSRVAFIHDESISQVLIGIVTTAHHINTLKTMNVKDNI